MPRPTYANGDVYCSRCMEWVYKQEIPVKTHYTKNAGTSHYHNACNMKMRLGGKRTPHENKEAARKQRLEYSGYGTIWLSEYPRKGAGIKRDILSELAKWERLVKPSYQYEESNNLLDYSYCSNNTNVSSPISAINLCADFGKGPTRNAATITERYGKRVRST